MSLAVQDARWAGRQLAFWQTLLAQSLPEPQVSPSAQPGQPEPAPPQSTAVSGPFFTPSLQAGTAQR